MLSLHGVDVGTMPLAGEKWRIVVRDTGFSKSGGELGQRWYTGQGSGTLGVGEDNGLSSLGLGFPVSAPVSSGAYFCMDVRFPSTGLGLPLSEIVRQWEDELGGEVVRIKRVPSGESSSAAATDRGDQLRAAIEEAPKPLTDELRQGARRAVDTLQLLFWAVIIGGVVYLVVKTRTFGK